MTELILKSFQKEAIQALEKHHHVLCVAPTGSGKSLIYERWASHSRERTLLISPLVSLARQQAQRLRGMGLSCQLIAGGSSRDASRSVDASPDVKIVSPECLEYPGYWRAFEKWSPQFLVVDECHCLWEWGGKFRPAYSRVPEWMKKLQIDRSLWLTATLPPIARFELKQSLAPLELKELGRFEIPDALKLSILCLDYPERVQTLCRLIVTPGVGGGLVFVNSRRWAEKLCLMLQKSLQEKIVFYHAGMSMEERKNVETLMQQGQVRVVVSTSAFGMGMDFSSVRWVMLWQPPWSLLSLAQAIGRVGRNGREGQAWVFWSEQDFVFPVGISIREREWVEVKNWCLSSGNKKEALVRYFNQ